MASMLSVRDSNGRDGQGRVTLSATTMRSLLDGIASRLDESRELSRYMTGLLVFLGLLGTFWGLLLTVNSVGETIHNLQVTGGDFAVMFDALKAGLEAPLSGMGTAFSTSLFGLSGSLVLGFLELQASQAQGRFHSELEEWLARATSLSSPLAGVSGGGVPAYVEALLERGLDVHLIEWEDPGVLDANRDLGAYIAQDLHANGVETTLIQRGQTMVLSINPSAKLTYAVYDGVPLEDPDPANKKQQAFSWMTLHEYKSDKPVAYPFTDIKSLRSQP